MFLSGVHSIGTFFSSEIPEPPGPRHPGHWADALALTLSAATTPNAQRPTPNPERLTSMVLCRRAEVEDHRGADRGERQADVEHRVDRVFRRMQQHREEHV